MGSIAIVQCVIGGVVFLVESSFWSSQNRFGSTENPIH